MRFAQAGTPRTVRRRGRGSHKTTVALAASAIAVTLTAAACQGSGTPATGGQAATITVAATRGVDDAPLYLAVKNGTFARAGLNVTIRTYATVNQELSALSNGHVDIAAGDYVDFFYQVYEERPHPSFLRIVADGYHAAPGVIEVLTYPGSGINSPQDLVHHTVGTPPAQGIPVSAGKPYSLETLATQSVLINDGINPADIKWRPMPLASLIGALAAHKVAAILVPEPYIFQAESRIGAIPVLDSCSGATASLPLSGYFTAASFAREHPQDVTAFRTALDQAQADAAQPGTVRAELATSPGMTTQSASLVTIGAYPTSLNVGSLTRVANLMFNSEMLSQALDVRALILR